MFIWVVKGGVALDCLSRVWGLGPLSLEYVESTEWFPATSGQDGWLHHQVGSIPLQKEWSFRLLVFQVYRFTNSLDRKWQRARWVSVSSTWLPYSMRAFTVSLVWRAYSSCSIPREIRCVFSQAWRMGLAYLGSNAYNFTLSLGADHMGSRTIRSNLIQCSSVSWHSLTKAHFKVWWDLSTFPQKL